MKKIILNTLFCSLFLSNLFAQGPNITIVNNTGYTIWNVYLSTTASDSWGTDKLDEDQVIAPNGSVSLQLPYPIDVVNHYDIRIKDSDGDYYTKMNVPVTASGRIEFTMDDYVKPVTYEGPNITIMNNTGYTIWNVYISQTASGSWGSDRLGSEEVLNAGSSISLPLPFKIDVVNRYDIRLKDSDGDTYTKMNILVSADGTVTFTIDDIDSSEL